MKRKLLRYFWVKPGEKPPRGAQLLNALLGLAILALALTFSFSVLRYEMRWERILGYHSVLIRGFLTTLGVSILALVISLTLGVLVAAAANARLLILRSLARIYIEGIRGTPLMVQVLIFYYVVANAAGINDRFVVGILIMAAFSGAYMAEIIRGGVESIPKTQWDSARSLGLSRWGTYRYVVFPQVLSRILPAVAGQLANLVKDSSLLSVVAIEEFFLAVRQANDNSFSVLEGYILMALGYLVLTYPISLWTKKLEAKLSYDN